MTQFLLTCPNEVLPPSHDSARKLAQIVFRWHKILLGSPFKKPAAASMASHIAQAPIRQTSNRRSISSPRNNALWQRQHMIVDRPGSGDPDITPPRGDMFQCTAQMPHAMWLTHQIGVERNAHHLRLAIRDLSYPFLEIINNHIRARRSRECHSPPEDREWRAAFPRGYASRSAHHPCTN